VTGGGTPAPGGASGAPGPGRTGGPDLTPPKRGGRPTKLTERLQNRLIALIQQGNYRETAAALSGISPATFHRWMERGAQGRHPYRAFREAVEHAETWAEGIAVRTVQSNIRAGDWKAAMTWLERKFPDRWGRRNRVEVSGRDGGPVTVAARPDLSKLTTEELQQLESILARADTLAR
jgi:transposase